MDLLTYDIIEILEFNLIILLLEEIFDIYNMFLQYIEDIRFSVELSEIKFKNLSEKIYF